MKYIEHVSYPGYGYIEPVMDMDDPLIEKHVAERLIAHYMDAFDCIDALREHMRSLEICQFIGENPKFAHWFVRQ